MVAVSSFVLLRLKLAFSVFCAIVLLSFPWHRNGLNALLLRRGSWMLHPLWAPRMQLALYHGLLLETRKIQISVKTKIALKVRTGRVRGNRPGVANIAGLVSRSLIQKRPQHWRRDPKHFAKGATINLPKVVTRVTASRVFPTATKTSHRDHVSIANPNPPPYIRAIGRRDVVPTCLFAPLVWLCMGRRRAACAGKSIGPVVALVAKLVFPHLTDCHRGIV